MSFELGKFSQEMQAKIMAAFNNDNKIDEQEARSLGLSKEQAKALSRELSGESQKAGDYTEFTQKDKEGNKQTITLYGDKKEGRLTLTKDSINFYRKKYPDSNIQGAYLKGGIVTLLDKDGQPAKDSMGNSITVDFNSKLPSKSINLVDFYMSHAGGNFDFNKMIEYQSLQDRLNSLEEADESYLQLKTEIETEKLNMMSYEERKNYMTSKMWNAYQNKDFSAWAEAVGEFYNYECEKMDDALKVRAAKDFIKDKTRLTALVEYIDKHVDDHTSELSKEELIWEVVKGVGDSIDSFIGTQGLTMIMGFGAATKLVTSVPKIGGILGGAIQVYFGTEGSVLIGSGIVDMSQAETKEQARGAGANIGLGAIMVHGAKKSVDNAVSTLKFKQFRAKMLETTTPEQLKIYQDAISSQPYSKEQKQALQVESLKQYAKIEQYQKANNTVSLEVKPTAEQNAEAAPRTFKSWEDIQQNKDNLDKDFSVVQMEIMKQYVLDDYGQIIPEHMAVLEKVLNTKELTSDEVIKLISSDKIPQEELLQIDEYTKIAKEKGFDIVDMMESSEQDFNVYVEQETQRIVQNRPKAKEQPSGITVTDNKDLLLQQIKTQTHYDFKRAKRELKSLTKEEVQKLSELLSSEKHLDRVGGYYNLVDYIRVVQKVNGADFELFKQCVQSGKFLDTGWDLLQVIDNNPARMEIAQELLKLNSQFEQIRTDVYSHQGNIIANERYWDTVLKDIHTSEQKDAYLLYLKSVPLKDIVQYSSKQPNMRDIKNVEEMRAWLEVKDYSHSIHRDEFRQLYVKLSPEDRKLFTKEQFENENQWSNGFSTQIDIMKLLLDPNFDSGYKAEIREFLKENPDAEMVYKFRQAINYSGNEPIFNIEHFRRIARFSKTGVEYDGNRFGDLTHGYTKEDGTFEYAYDNEYLDRWYNALTNEAVQKALGRKFTMEEAKSFSWIKEDWKQNYVIKNLREGMTERDVEDLCERVRRNIKNENQLKLADFLGKDYTIPTTDGKSLRFDYHIFERLVEKEDIDAFCKIFSEKEFSQEQAVMYSQFIGSNFAKNVEFMEMVPNLTETIGKDLAYNYMNFKDVICKTSDYGKQVMYELDKFIKSHPEMSSKIKSFVKTSSGRYENILTNIDSQEIVERIRKNLEIVDNMSSEDIEILKEIFIDEINWTHEIDFASMISAYDLSKEKFDILKPLYLKSKGGENTTAFATCLTREYDIDILKTVAKQVSDIEKLSNHMYKLEGSDIELIKTLLSETDFELDMVEDIGRQDVNQPNRQDNTINEVKQLAKTYKQNSISRNEAYVMMLNIREVTQDMAQKMLVKANISETKYSSKNYQYNEMHMLYFAKTISKLVKESNKELINTFLNDDYFTVDMIQNICQKKYVFEEINYWSPEKDMPKALDVAKNYTQKGMTGEEAYVMLLNIPAMTKNLAQKIINSAKTEEASTAQKENRQVSQENINKAIINATRAVVPETTELTEVLYEDENLNISKINDIINYKNNGYASVSAAPKIMEIAKTYKQKGIDKTKAYLMMLNPFSITEGMAEKVLKQVKDEVDASRELSSILPNHKSKATDNSRYEFQGRELVRYISADKAELAEYLLDTPEWNDRTWKIKNILENTKDAHEVLDICKNYDRYELTQEQAVQVIESKGELSAKDLSKLNKIFGRKKVTEMSETDRYTAAKFVDIIDVQNINEISIGGKKKLLRALVENNDGSFQISEELRKRLPIVPRNVEEYCPLLRSIVRSIGIETEPLTPEQRLQIFNSSIKDLSKSLAELSDKDFADLTITLEEQREEFIEIVREKIKDLSSLERQKVFDYYGFELHKNKNNPTGYSISGYPVNLNNGRKLALIENPNTKAVVEALRPDVIKFSKQNKIKCNNPQIEQLLNEVLDGLPEIRLMIGKSQHSSHEFDVMQHSLKVMQKLVQDPQFEKLSENDKKIMLLASLLHDITKGEGYSDRTHATESSFDAFYISQKFKLSRDYVLKLFTLIEHHEWLGEVNTKRSEESLTKALQRTAFYLQNDNLFELALMFTHADLKAVKRDNSFHDKTTGSSRVNFRGEVHSFGEAADIHAQRIREYVNELKANKPFTPVTQIPTTSAIKSRIGSVDADGKARDKAGNIINGLYVRESDGLVIIKHNEVTDWEAIGYSKGTTSKGITGIGKIRDTYSTEGAVINEAPYETGNVHYFMHGLDYPNQLMKFEAFAQPDSRAMLSLTYLERPESKPRGFRSQGILLDFRNKYIYGGGETDAGSGCGKSVSEFVENYCFGGQREKDRTMVSELIKKSTGMSDEEYIRFIEENQNKEWSEIEPVELRNKMIKGLADGIISTGRRHDRAYDEFYGSNPERVMATFAYEANVEATIDNPVEFINNNSRRLDYLIRFNHDHDIPIVLLGD